MKWFKDGKRYDTETAERLAQTVDANEGAWVELWRTQNGTLFGRKGDKLIPFALDPESELSPSERALRWMEREGFEAADIERALPDAIMDA